jgi:lipid II:glycine glycyltransferase (peptidoglycan interpeptide bridge formation enzyme)
MDELGQPDMVDQWRSFKAAEDGVLLLAEAQGRILGGLAVVREGHRAMARSGGTLPILPKLPRMHNLIWESMRIMKARGCTEYDLAGLPDDPNYVKEDERRREQFKLAFNPRIVKLVPIYCAALRPLDHAVLFTTRQWYRGSAISRLIGPRLSRK